MKNTPKTVSISIQDGHLSEVSELTALRARRNMFVSRSGLIREALTIGLRALRLKEESAVREIPNQKETVQLTQ